MIFIHIEKILNCIWEKDFVISIILKILWRKFFQNLLILNLIEVSLWEFIFFRLNRVRQDFKGQFYYFQNKNSTQLLKYKHSSFEVIWSQPRPDIPKWVKSAAFIYFWQRSKLDAEHRSYHMTHMSFNEPLEALKI